MVGKDRVMQCVRRGAITCNEDTTLHFVAQIMVVNRIRYCIVLDNRREIVGLISSDAMIDAFGKDFETTRAKDILTREGIATVTLSTPLKDAVALMAKGAIEQLIVVSDKPERSAVIGMLFAADVISFMAKELKEGAAP